MDVDSVEDARKARSAGCVGAMAAIPVFILLFLASSLSDCFPTAPCDRSVVREAVVPSFLIALIISQCCYWTIRWAQRHRR